MMPKQSWENVAQWYDSLIGEKGGYFHTHVIFPKTIALMSIKSNQKLLDLACGQGAFTRELARKQVSVTGVDVSDALIERAKSYEQHAHELPPSERVGTVSYVVDDARKLESVGSSTFDRIVSILAIQNIDPVDAMFHRIHELLKDGGTFTFVILHPAFRSPRITGWGEDEGRKLQYRRVDRYMTPMEVPITMNPGKESSPLTWTYHRPLSFYVTALRQAHLYVDAMEEWTSDKQSVGTRAREENLAREEIPMFMAIRAKRLNHA